MKNIVHLSFIFFLTFLFWLSVFAFERVVFMTYYFDAFSKIEVSQIFQCFIQGLRLDLSTAGYLMALPLVSIFLTGVFIKKDKALKIYSFLVVIEIIIIAIIHTAELGAYGEWGHKLSSRVFMHLMSPSEVFRTTGYRLGLLSVLLIIIEIVFCVLLFRIVMKFAKTKAFQVDAESKVNPGFSCVLVSICWLAISFLFVRGGLQQIPINIDAAYFSKHIIANDVAVNSSYYFGNSFFLYNKNDLDKYVPQKISNRDKENATNYYKQHSNDESMFNLKSPNVVFIIFEGWSSHAMGSISDEASATPFFDNLTKDGVLFTKCYASNTTSEIGNATIFSGFTGIPESPISLYPEKHRNLFTISDALKIEKYSSSYIFSGDLKYGNIQGFLMEHSFDQIQDEQNFNQNLPKGKLNFYDQDLYAKLLKTISKQKEPFLSCAFTGSTHFPYDYPKRRNIFKGKEADYLNSMVYADDCLKSFFQEAKTKKWYKNTIFVLISDHGHASPKSDSPYDPEFFRIPFAIIGEPVKHKYRGLKIDKVCSQGDVAATLLKQMEISTKDFPYSRNVCSDKTIGGAFLSTIRGVGFVSNKGGYLFNFDANRCLTNSYINTTAYNKDRRLGDACFLELYNYFNLLDAK